MKCEQSFVWPGFLWKHYLESWLWLRRQRWLCILCGDLSVCCSLCGRFYPFVILYAVNIICLLLLVIGNSSDCFYWLIRWCFKVELTSGQPCVCSSNTYTIRPGSTNAGCLAFMIFSGRIAIVNNASFRNLITVIINHLFFRSLPLGSWGGSNSSSCNGKCTKWLYFYLTRVTVSHSYEVLKTLSF